MSPASTSPDSQATALVQGINSYRLQNSLTPLATSPALSASAQWKSGDMAANGYFTHDDLNRTWSQRVHDCGYTASPSVAENLAEGAQDGAAALVMWENSPAHNANLLDSSMRAVGVARSADPSGGWYWTADFGAVADTAPTPLPQSAVRASDTPGPSGTPAASSASSGGSASPSLTAASIAGAGVGLSVGAAATVTGAGDCLHVHSSPAVGAPIAACLVDGTAVTLSDGPRDGDGYTWWKVGATGWSVSAYLAPASLPQNGARVPDASAPAPAASAVPARASSYATPAPTPIETPAPGAGAGLVVGGTATVAGTGKCLHVHALPALNAPRTACLDDGAVVTLTDGPRLNDGYTWWKLGADGWAVSAYLVAAGS